VETPKKISDFNGSRVKWISCGKTFTVCLQDEGNIYRWGKDFGILPKKIQSEIVFEKLHACMHTGELIGMEKNSGTLHTIDISGTVSRLQLHGKPLRALDVCASRNAWIFVDSISSSLIEIPRNTFFSPSLYPAGTLLLCPARSVWTSPSGMFASEHATTGEVRIWCNQSFPAKIHIKSTGAAAGEWIDAMSDFFLKNISVLALPLSGRVGYALCREDNKIFRFRIEVNAQHTGEVVRFNKPVAWTTIAWDSHGLIAVDTAGNMFIIPHETEELVKLSSLEPRLKQVDKVIASSGHHIAAYCKIFSHIEPLSSNPRVSLQTICTQTIMTNLVTVENVSGIAEQLLDRAVIDLPHLIDCCFSFLRLNKNLISIIDPQTFRRLEMREDYQALHKFNCDEGVSSALLHLRQEIHSLIPAPISEAVPFSPSASMEKKTKNTFLNQRPSMPSCSTSSGSGRASPVIECETPRLTCASIEPETIPSPLILDEFFPLSDLTNTRIVPPAQVFKKRVVKWKRQRAKTCQVTAPWNLPGEPHSLKTSQSTFHELIMEQVDEQKSRKPVPSNSRWFLGLVPRPVALPELIRQEQEKNEEIEAIRLVEEYEMAQSARIANESKHENQKRGRKASTVKFNSKFK
jgi:hypothetical protein